MTSPILRIYPDVWQNIALFLGAASIHRLICIGSPSLTTSVTRGIRQLDVTDAHGILDIESLLDVCKGMKSLGSLSISDSDVSTVGSWVKTPLQPFSFPSSLTRLHLHFGNAFLVLKPLDFSRRLPSLLHLSIRDPYGDAHPRFSDFQLPPLLESLTLLPKHGGILLSISDIESLPRTLISLCLRIEWVTEGDWTKYVWPLSLQSFTLHCMNSSPMIEHLPRTVSELNVSGINGLTTGYRGSTCLDQGMEFYFPWRIFFPRLLSLKLSPEDVRFRHVPMLRSIVVPDLDLENAIDFISNGFWNLPSELPTSKREFPNLKFVEIPMRGLWNDLAQWKHELERLAPYLQGTELGVFDASSPPLGLVDLLGSNVKILSRASWLRTKLSQRVISLDTAYFDLQTLHSELIYLKGWSYSKRPTALPPKLQTLLSLHVLPREAWQNFPKTITVLQITIKHGSDWDTLASSLPVLKELGLELRPCWRLHPSAKPFIATKSLTKLRLDHRCDVNQLWTSAEAMFREKLFPASLASLDVYTARATLFAALPDNIRRLKVHCLRPVKYTSSEVKIFPFELLPRKLLSLDYTCLRREEPMSHLLAKLPSTLVFLVASVQFEKKEDELLLTESLKSLPLLQWTINDRITLVERS